MEPNCSEISKPSWKFGLSTSLPLGVYWSCTLILALTSAITVPVFLVAVVSTNWPIYVHVGKGVVGGRS